MTESVWKALLHTTNLIQWTCIIQLLFCYFFFQYIILLKLEFKKKFLARHFWRIPQRGFLGRGLCTLGIILSEVPVETPYEYSFKSYLWEFLQDFLLEISVEVPSVDCSRCLVSFPKNFIGVLPEDSFRSSLWIFSRNWLWGFLRGLPVEPSPGVSSGDFSKSLFLEFSWRFFHGVSSAKSFSSSEDSSRSTIWVFSKS